MPHTTKTGSHATPHLPTAGRCFLDSRVGPLGTYPASHSDASAGVYSLAVSTACKKPVEHRRWPACRQKWCQVRWWKPAVLWCQSVCSCSLVTASLLGRPPFPPFTPRPAAVIPFRPEGEGGRGLESCEPSSLHLPAQQLPPPRPLAGNGPPPVGRPHCQPTR